MSTLFVCACSEQGPDLVPFDFRSELNNGLLKYHFPLAPILIIIQTSNQPKETNMIHKQNITSTLILEQTSSWV